MKLFPKINVARYTKKSRAWIFKEKFQQSMRKTTTFFLAYYTQGKTSLAFFILYFALFKQLPDIIKIVHISYKMLKLWNL